MFRIAGLDQTPAAVVAAVAVAGLSEVDVEDAVAVEAEQEPVAEEAEAVHEDVDVEEPNEEDVEDRLVG